MKKLVLALLILATAFAQGQVYQLTSGEENMEVQHRILMDSEYIIETIYQIDPPKFILTRGGYYKKEGNQLVADLEFNSNFEKDSLAAFKWDKREWELQSSQAQVLDGKWLMGGRVKPEGEQRRDITRSRKTLKFLVDGYFQWTAYNTEGFKFFGSGGGAFTSKEGTYTEHIEYFSRDNNKAGMSLSFEYNRKGNDWYHKGKSSKGQPMHEIWTQRPAK